MGLQSIYTDARHALPQCAAQEVLFSIVKTVLPDKVILHQCSHLAGYLSELHALSPHLTRQSAAAAKDSGQLQCCARAMLESNASLIPDVLDASAGRATRRGAIIFKCGALRPLPKNLAPCVSNANILFSGCACPAHAAAHPCRLRILCRPSIARLHCGLRSCPLGSRLFSAFPGPEPGQAVFREAQVGHPLYACHGGAGSPGQRATAR